MRCFKFTSDQPNIIYVKHALTGDFKSITVSKTGPNNSAIVPMLDEQILQKYNESISLDVNKVKDLKKLLPFIPKIHWSFYAEIFAKENKDKDPLNGFNHVEDI